MDVNVPQPMYDVISLFDGSFCVCVTEADGRRHASADLWTREAAERWIEQRNARRQSGGNPTQQ